jgi:hypothetical protein
MGKAIATPTPANDQEAKHPTKHQPQPPVLPQMKILPDVIRTSDLYNLESSSGLAYILSLETFDQKNEVMLWRGYHCNYDRCPLNSKVARESNRQWYTLYSTAIYGDVTMITCHACNMRWAPYVPDSQQEKLNSMRLVTNKNHLEIYTHHFKQGSYVANGAFQKYPVFTFAYTIWHIVPMLFGLTPALYRTLIDTGGQLGNALVLGTAITFTQNINDLRLVAMFAKFAYSLEATAILIGGLVSLVAIDFISGLIYHKEKLNKVIAYTQQERRAFTKNGVVFNKYFVPKLFRYNPDELLDPAYNHPLTAFENDNAAFPTDHERWHRNWRFALYGFPSICKHRCCCGHDPRDINGPPPSFLAIQQNANPSEKNV